MSQQNENIVNSPNCSVGPVTTSENKFKRRDLDDRDTGEIETNVRATIPSTKPTNFATKQAEFNETAIKTLQTGIDKSKEILATIKSIFKL